MEAAREARIEPMELLVSNENVEPRLIAELTDLAHPPRVIGVFRRSDLPRLVSDTASDTGLALWRVGDPGNVGTLLRSADAFGAFVALSDGCADPTGPKALRASAGAIFRVPTCSFDEAPGRRVALVPEGGRPLAELELGDAVVFVLGSEREGLPAEVIRACDELASIPTAGSAESLNVATAGAIALYARRRSI